MAKEANKTISRQVEEIAAEIIRSWVGEKGTVVDTGEGDGPDFQIWYEDGRFGIGEVGLHEDPEVAEAWANIEKSETPQQIALPPSSGTWSAGFATVPKIKRLETDLPKLITSLRDQGLNELCIYGEYPRGEVADFARKLGINYISHHLSGNADQVIYFLPPTGGAVPTDPDIIVDWIEEVLLSDDFKDSWTKLLPIQSDEQHVFFMTSSRTPFGIDELLNKSKLPTRVPKLLGNLTHIWIQARYGGAGPIYWCEQSNWQRF